MKYMVSFVLFFLLYGCSTNAIHHDEAKALQEASIVLNTLYFEKNYQKAYDMFDEGFKKAYSVKDLEHTVETLKEGYGKLLKLESDSFQPVAGRRVMVLFFIGEHGKRRSYHQVTMIGDANGYKVYGLYVDPEPIKGTNLKQAFKKGKNDNKKDQ